MTAVTCVNIQVRLDLFQKNIWKCTVTKCSDHSVCHTLVIMASLSFPTPIHLRQFDGANQLELDMT